MEKYKRGELSHVTEDEIWAAQHLVNSAYHPETGERQLIIFNVVILILVSGEKMFLPGRLSAQVPINMTITGCMMTFYKSTPAVIFWHWVNQSFNAVVNYTNR